MKKSEKGIRGILNSISPEDKKRMNEEMEAQIEFLEDLEKKGHKWSTPTSFSLVVLKERGFNPTKITSMYAEETFIFKTDEEAKLAWGFDEMCFDGWYYGEEEFEAIKKNYECEIGVMKIYDL